MRQKKMLDAVAFMRKRREELSRDYGGLSAEQIEERVQQSLKKDAHQKPPSPPKRITGNYHSHYHDYC